MDSLPTFPTTLPAPIVDDYSLSFIDSTRSVNFDNGLSRGLTVSAINLGQLSVSWRLSHAQYSALFNFYHVSCLKGRVRFRINLAYAGEPEEVIARFTGNLSTSVFRSFGLWQVSTTISFIYPTPDVSGVFTLTLPQSGVANSQTLRSDEFVESFCASSATINEALNKLNGLSEEI